MKSSVTSRAHGIPSATQAFEAEDHDPFDARRSLDNFLQHFVAPLRPPATAESREQFEIGARRTRFDGVLNLIRSECFRLFKSDARVVRTYRLLGIKPNRDRAVVAFAGEVFPGRVGSQENEKQRAVRTLQKLRSS